jgi:hypothetical protein
MCQSPTSSQTIQVSNLSDQIARQDQCCQVGNHLTQPPVHIPYSIPCAQQSIQSRTEGNVRQRRYVIVRKVDGILLTSNT